MRLITHKELHNELLNDPEYRAVYEAALKNQDPDYQIVRHHKGGTEEVVFDTLNGNHRTPFNVKMTIPGQVSVFSVPAPAHCCPRRFAGGGALFTAVRLPRFEQHLNVLGYDYRDETGNAAFTRFLSPQTSVPAR